MELEITKLPDVIRNTDFGTLSNNIIVTDDGSIIETVTNVDVIVDKQDSGITLSNTLSSITISGSYEDQFNDEGEYVSKGSSNLIEDPTIFQSISDLPPNQDLYQFEQDPKNKETITYNVSITYNRNTTSSDSPSTTLSENGLIFEDSFTQDVRNDDTLGYHVLRDYFNE